MCVHILSDRASESIKVLLVLALLHVLPTSKNLSLLTQFGFRLNLFCLCLSNRGWQGMESSFDLI